MLKQMQNSRNLEPQKRQQNHPNNPKRKRASEKFWIVFLRILPTVALGFSPGKRSTKRHHNWIRKDDSPI